MCKSLKLEEEYFRVPDWRKEQREIRAFRRMVGRTFRSPGSFSRIFFEDQPKQWSVFYCPTPMQSADASGWSWTPPFIPYHRSPRHIRTEILRFVAHASL